MIVATAGHIDHGKTTLVKALTGVDADRLPEEKKRGITVDLGFAYGRDVNGRSLGFVDVPGHEKLVRTMLAGAGGADFVMLVVAADDGIMPQTREHLAILDLLGISCGVAVLTKIDKVGADRVATVAAEVRALLAVAGLPAIGVLPVSAHRGDGIADLRIMLACAAAEASERNETGGFRLAIDRAFTLPGAGLVVTGTVHSGRVAAGDRLVVSPLGREIRVRSVHAQNEATATGVAGQRCALNISGARVEKTDLARGDWIISPALSAPTSRADVRLRLLSSEAKPLRHWTPVHVHIGSADICGRIVLLEASSLAPGDRALGQILLDQPTSALTGDCFVIRDQSAQRTIGGGRIIDPLPPARGARKADRLRYLRALEAADDGEALDALLADAPRGIDLGHFALARNIEPARLETLHAARDAVEAGVQGKRLLFAPTRWSAWRDDVLAAVRAYQDGNPDSFGATTAEILRAAPVLDRPVLAAALDQLIAEKTVARFGQLLHLPGHAVELARNEDKIWFEIERHMRNQGNDPPRLALVCEMLRLQESDVKPLLEKLGRMGRLRRVSKTYFVLPDVVRRLAEAASGCAQAHPQAILTVGQFREATGVSRNATMPILEFFDRIGLTSRMKDGRRMRGTVEAIFGPV